MIIFAWIIWGSLILIFMVKMALFVGAVCASSDPDKKVNFDSHWKETLIEIVFFIFLSLYIFL